MGRRVAKHLKGLGTVEEIVLPVPRSIATSRPSRWCRRRPATRRHRGGGLRRTVDTCKYATFKDGRKYATFGTAASMNGYAASTASVTLDNGYKTSLPAHAPRGIFLDLQVSALRRPTGCRPRASATRLCRPTAQVEWWASHRLFDTFYSQVPYDSACRR